MHITLKSKLVLKTYASLSTNPQQPTTLSLSLEPCHSSNKCSPPDCNVTVRLKLIGRDMFRAW